MARHSQLSIFHRACSGNPSRVANQHIFNRERLEPDDHAYLETHLDALSWEDLARWLMFAPENPQRLVERIVESFPPAKPGNEPEFLFPIGALASFVRWWEPGLLEEIADRLRPPRLAAYSWWEIAHQLKDVCPSYATILAGDAHTIPLALALFDYRRNEVGFPRALAAALRAHSGWIGAYLLAFTKGVGLLDGLSPQEVLPEVLRFHGEDDASSTETAIRDIALAWPGEGAAAARAWFLGQIAAAAARGVAPHVLWAATPPELREAAAFFAQDVGHVLPWLVISLSDALNRRDPSAWDRFFRYLETPGALDRSKMSTVMLRDRRGVRGPDATEPVSRESGPQLDAIALHLPAHFAQQLLFQAPLPDDPDDAFEARLVRHAETIPSSVDDRGLMPLHLLHRRASFPLTRDRANRLLHEVLAKGNLFLVEGLLGRLAAAADPLTEAELPPIERIVHHAGDADGLALFRALAGPLADERIRAWIRAPLSQSTEDAKRESSRDRPFDEAFMRAAMCPELVPPDVQEWLVAEARKEPICRMAGLVGHSILPWLVDEATLVEAALDRAETELEPWSWGDCPTLPTSLLPAVRRRVRSRAPREQELVDLLRWLEARGEPFGDLIAVMLGRLAEGKPRHEAIRWLVSALASRTRWAHHGRDVLLSLIDAEAWSELSELLRRVAPDPITDAERKARHRMVIAVHDALARTLVRIAERALDRGAEGEAIGALHGLAALHPLTSVRRLVHQLRGKSGAASEIEDLVALNEELLRRDTTHEARAHDVRVAISLLLERRAPSATVEPELETASS
jgi:hypothetical protein